MNRQPNLFKSTQILYYAMLIGQVMLAIMIVYIMKEGAASNEPVRMPYNLLIPGAVVISVGLSYLIGQRQKEKIPVSSTLGEKLGHHRKYLLLRGALQEAGNLIAIVLAFLTGSMTMLTWFGIGLAAFLLLRPTIDSFAEAYRLTPSERNALT